MLIIGGLQALLWLYLFVYIWQHTNPTGDGTEWVGVMPGTLIFVLFGVPVLWFGYVKELLLVALVLGSIGAVLNLAFFAEMASELAHG